MPERFRMSRREKGGVEGLPDVKFYGFGNEVLPYRVGIDVDGYSQLLQDTLKIGQTDVSRIALRFIGIPQFDDTESAIEDARELSQTYGESGLVRTVTVGHELLAIGSIPGVSLDQIERESMQELVSSLLGGKLAFESIAIKDELLHEKLDKKATSKISPVLHKPVLPIGGFVLGEYLLQDIPWVFRTAILLYGLAIARLGVMKVDRRVAVNHNQVHEDLETQVLDVMFSSQEESISPKEVEKWAQLITVYPSTPDTK